MGPLQEGLGILIVLKGYQNCQLSIVNCQFGEAAKHQFIFPPHLTNHGVLPGKRAVIYYSILPRHRQEPFSPQAPWDWSSCFSYWSIYSW